VKITSRGQVTIPIAIRRRFGLLQGTEVAFEAWGGAVVIRRARKRGRRGANVVERLRGKATSGLSTDEILALTRG
jgi:AbrB family looped-hinge helix DNA binding protein